MKVEFDVDPAARMDLIPVSPDCPRNLVFLVRWLKGLVMFQSTDLVADRDKVLLIIDESVNSPHWPPGTIWSFEISKERVIVLVDRAIEWISTKETF